MTQALENSHPESEDASRTTALWSAGRVGLVLIAVLAAAMPLVTVMDLRFPGRTLLALAFVLAVPGVPIVRLLRLPGRLAAACSGVALSLAAQLLICVGLLSVGLFSGLAVQFTASAIALVATALALRVDKSSSVLDVAALVEWPRRLAIALQSARLTAASLTAVLVLWVIGVKTADPTAMNGFGFISIVGWAIPLAIVLLAVTAITELRRANLRIGWLAVIAVAFVVVLQGTIGFVEPVASLPVGYLHVGFAEYIQDNNAVLDGFDARFSWPGFFALLASVATAAGLSDGADLLRWAPLVQNLLVLFPLVLLASSLTSSRRTTWLAVILYSCGNWFQQDYLSPQALSLLLAVTVIAVLAWSTQAPVPVSSSDTANDRPLSIIRSYLIRPPGRPDRVVGLDSTQSLWLGAVLLALMAATVVSHQLTPVMLVLDLAIFSLARRTRFPGLWIVLAVMVTAWVSFGASDFWVGHLNQIFGGVGNLGSNLNAGVTDRISGTAEHQSMLYARIAVSAAFVALAVIGLIRIRRSGNLILVGGLAFAPFLLLAVQSYGGEVFVRCFVFALPALAIAAAAALTPWLKSRSILSGVAVASVLAVLSLALVAARGGNAEFERITQSQIDGLAAIESAAPAGGTVASLNYFTPLASLQLDAFRSKAVGPARCGGIAATPQCIVNSGTDFVYVSSSQEAYGEVVEGRPDGWAWGVVTDVIASGSFEILYQADDVVVLQNVQSESD